MHTNARWQANSAAAGRGRQVCAKTALMRYMHKMSLKQTPGLINYREKPVIIERKSVSAISN